MTRHLKRSKTLILLAFSRRGGGSSPPLAMWFEGAEKPLFSRLSAFLMSQKVCERQIPTNLYKFNPISGLNSRSTVPSIFVNPRNATCPDPELLSCPLLRSFAGRKYMLRPWGRRADYNHLCLGTCPKNALLYGFACFHGCQASFQRIYCNDNLHDIPPDQAQAVNLSA